MASNHALKTACETNVRNGISSMYPFTSHIIRLIDATDVGKQINQLNPCDFIVHLHVNAPKPFESNVVYIECKATKSVERFAFSCLEDSQVRGMDRAVELQIPYYVVFWMAQHNRWFVIPAQAIQQAKYEGKKSFSLKDLEKFSVPDHKQLWNVSHA